MATNREIEEDTYMDPALEEELFGSVEESDTTSTSPDTTNTAAPSPISSATSTSQGQSQELDEETIRQRCFGPDAVTGLTRPSTMEKTSAMLEREEEKRLKLERRMMALNDTETAKYANLPATTMTGAGAQKRKRGDDDETGEKAAKRSVTDAVAAGMQQPIALPATNGAQKRKRADDDEQVERATKRGLTDAVAAEIAQQGGEAAEQHLAPPTYSASSKTAANDLTIYEDDDEFTRMLKEELAKPFVDEYSDDEDEPEDPRVEEIMQGLTETEKLTIAKHLEKWEIEGHEPVTLEKLAQMVKIALKTREDKAKKAAAKAAHARKQTSPLANDGVKNEEQEIDRRPKLAPKSRKPAPSTALDDATSPVSPPPPAAASTPGGDSTTTPASSGAASPSASGTPPPQGEAYVTLTIPDLKEKCRDRGLIVGGNKKDIIQRLLEYDADFAAGRVPKGHKAPPKK